MDCIITVKGYKSGATIYGSPAQDKTGPVSEFIVDNTIYYTAVRGHLKKCDKCVAEEILRTYLQRRIEIPKFQGICSTRLIDLAFEYEGLKNHSISKDLVNEFILRSGHIPTLAKHFTRLSPEQVVRGILKAIEAWKRSFKLSSDGDDGKWDVAVSGLFSMNYSNVLDTKGVIYNTLRVIQPHHNSNPEHISEIINLANMRMVLNE